jgi:hypothetical protein
VSSSSLTSRVHLGCDAYLIAVHRFDLSLAARERAAADVRDILEELGSGSTASAAVEELVARLQESDGFKRNAAARLLAGLPSRQASEALLAAYAARVGLSPGHLRYLGRPRSPGGVDGGLGDEHWGALPSLPPGVHAPFVYALLRSPSPEGRRRFRDILNGGNDAVSQAAIAAVSRWREPALLWAVIEEWIPPTGAAPSGMPELRPADLRLDAAFHLAIGGDRRAVDRLMEAAHGSRKKVDDRFRAADAILHLAALAWPGAVPPLAEQLGQRSRYLVELLLDAAGTLRAAALGPALLDLATHSVDKSGASVADDALDVLAAITGKTSPETPGTPALRRRAIIEHRTALVDLDPALRYASGAPLAPSTLVDELTSIHAGPVTGAAFNLRAMSGEDGGFDPDDDLVENLPGLAFWRARARRTDPPLMTPGGWAFAGSPLAPLGESDPA